MLEAVPVDRERRGALQGLGVSFCERLLFLTQIHGVVWLTGIGQAIVEGSCT